jgi:transcriptional regulator with XRE-family HTH domain
MDSFGSRLRHERERRQIALKSIAESTKIGIPLLEALERDDVSRWPSGIFRKSFVKSYAMAVGLDPEPIVREFVERHPDPLEGDIAAPSAGARPSAASHSTTPHITASPSSAGPLAIKLTITWSGSVHHTIGRLADWKIVRMLLDGKRVIHRFMRRNLTIANLRSHKNLRILRSANLPMLNARGPHGSGGEASDQAPRA